MDLTVPLAHSRTYLIEIGAKPRQLGWSHDRLFGKTVDANAACRNGHVVEERQTETIAVRECQGGVRSVEIRVVAKTPSLDMEELHHLEAGALDRRGTGEEQRRYRSFG